MRTNGRISSRRSDAISRGIRVTTKVYVDKALNAELWGKGKGHFDFAADIAVVNTCHQVVPYENNVRLAERVNDAVPGDSKKRTIFMTTGAEGVETDIKIAGAATNRSAIASMIGSVPQIADIRGLDFMSAVEFNIPDVKSPNADFTNKVRETALSKGLMLLTCGVYGDVIRFFGSAGHSRRHIARMRCGGLIHDHFR